MAKQRTSERRRAAEEVSTRMFVLEETSCRANLEVGGRVNRRRVDREN